VPLIAIGKLRMIKYWIKILKADDSNLVKRVYLVLKAECEENNPTNGQGNIFPVVKFLIG